MVHSQAADGGDSLQKWKVAANILVLINVKWALVTTMWQILRLWMEETIFRHGG
jgi:hypothetical protein